MQCIVKLGAILSRCAPQEDTSTLIGSPITESPGPKKKRPMHPCFLQEDDAPSEDSEELANVFTLVDQENKIELQYATIVFLSVDAAEREKVASLSPPAAAELTRKIPEILHKSMVGTKYTAAQPPVELVVRFTYEIERVFST